MFLAFFVYVKNPKRFLNRIYAIYTLSISWWSLFSIPMIQANDAMQATFWDRLCLMGTVFIPSTFIHFNYTFLKLNKKKAKIIKICYGLSSIFWISLFTPFFIQGTEFKSVGLYFSKPSFLYALFILYFFTASIYGIFCLYRKMITLPKETYYRKQVFFLFWATLLGYTGGGFNFNLVFNIPPYNVIPCGNYAVGIYGILIAYAIVRHQLMDIEVIIKKTLVFAGLLIASYAVLASFAYLGSVVFANVIQNRWLAMAPSVLIIVLMLRPLESFLRTATDKYLFQKKYDYKQLLKTFTDEVLTVLNLNELVDITVNKLANIIKLESAAILLHDEENKELKTVASIGLKKLKYVLSDEDDLVEYMEQSGEYIALEGIGQKKSTDQSFENKLRELHSELIIPLVHSKKVIGILSLGKKKSDEEFTQDDIDILLPLARTLTIAITNAQLFVRLSESQAQAAQREKMAVIGTLSAGINHEICNPLSIIRGQCEMFLLNLKEGLYKTKKPQELLKMAQGIMSKVIDEADRATIITRKLSSFAKPAERRSENNIRVEDEVGEVISLVEHDLKLSNIAILREMADDLPCVLADPKQLQEIFFNIIRNGAQAIKEGGSITIRAKSDKKKIYIDIEDTGTGIDEELLKQIFNPFFTTKSPGEGTGLGLFIVKQIVEKNDGEITIESELGKGTIVHLMFNAAREGVKAKSR